MTPNQQAAYTSGIQAILDLATIAAATIEARDDAREVRQQAAAAALLGLVEGAKALLPSTPNPLIRTMHDIAADPADSGSLPCPTCAGTFRWMKDASNGHIHGQCETDRCLTVMQ